MHLIYQDDSLLVANKPAGLLAVPGRGADKQDCFSARVQAEFHDALVVHRLDMATSGLMVFARGAEMQRRLSRMFHDRKIQKRYIAVVAGRVEGKLIGRSPSPALPRWEREPLAGERGLSAASSEREGGHLLLLPPGVRKGRCAAAGHPPAYPLRVEGWDGGFGEISLPLMADWPNRPLQKVDHAEGKHSLTRYRVLTYDAKTDVTRVELEPITGRTHQLRVHMAAIGHPIIGDALYGGLKAERLFLHASLLGFHHPSTGAAVEFHSKAPFLGCTVIPAEAGIQPKK